VKTRVVIALALTAAAVRLIFLHFLHPLNWDEIEYWRATSWIADGRLPFRDFWEHHTPLMWFLFAPFAMLTDTPGVGAVIGLRWAQVLVWIGTFWLANLFMRGAGIGRFARWAAMSLALSSSLLMIPAVEYRVDSLGCMLVMAGLVLVQRERFFLAGAVFCLAGFANIRLGPMLVVAVLLVLLTRKLRAAPIVAGGFAALAACLAFFAATGSLQQLYQQVWVENLAEKYATPVQAGFIHRILVPFGVRIIGSDRLFELAAVDVGGVTVLLTGVAGLWLALRRWRERGDLFNLSVLALTNLFFTAYMKFIYNYHFALVVVLFVPLIAMVIDVCHPERRARDLGGRGGAEHSDTRSPLGYRVVFAVLLLAWCVNAFASVFRGKELDRAYQDLIMREVHTRTKPGDAVFSGIPWGLRREAAYWFWFLPELPRQLVPQKLARPYEMREPPAAVVFDHNLLLWLGRIQRELAPYLIRHYIPVWRELWIPGMNARLAPGRRFEWTVPRDGEYRLHVSAGLARHPWFRDPIRTAIYKRPDSHRLIARLPETSAGAPLDWTVDGQPAQLGETVRLRRGQRIAATSRANVPVAVILLSTNDRVLFRQPPPGVTLEAETTRITHVPELGVRLEP